MDRKMINYLPEISKDIKEMKVTMELEQSEFSDTWSDILNVFNDQFVIDATKNGASRWEKILNIKPKATDNLDTRKFRIISRLNESIPYTMITLRQMLQTLCGEGGYFIELHNDIYTLMVKVALKAKSNFDDVDLLLKRVVPANMIIELSLKYNQHVTLGQFKHNNLKHYKQSELRDEVIKLA